jgi:hypothetical protein
MYWIGLRRLSLWPQARSGNARAHANTTTMAQ